MSYHIYTTEGIVLKRKGLGEADIFVYILTSDLGLIIAGAKSARLEKSKLKGALQEYSLISLSCIKGKNGWKLTSADLTKDLFFEKDKNKRHLVAQLADFLVKNIIGEIPQRKIFEIVNSGLLYLDQVSKEDLKDFEVLFLLRIMKELGYVEAENVKDFVDNLHWSTEILKAVSSDRIRLVGFINKAIKESQI